MTPATQSPVYGEVEVVYGECVEPCPASVRAYEHPHAADCASRRPVAYRAKVYERCDSCDPNRPGMVQPKPLRGWVPCSRCDPSPIPGMVPAKCYGYGCCEPACDAVDGSCDLVQYGSCPHTKCCSGTGHAYQTMSVERYGEIVRTAMTEALSAGYVTLHGIPETELQLAEAITSMLHPPT